MKNIRKIFIVAFIFVASAVAFFSDLLSSFGIYNDLFLEDLSGRWRIDLVIEETSYRPYEGMSIGYVVYLKQEGERVYGNGEKRWENGKEISFSERVRLDLDGKVDGDQVDFIFRLHGRKRSTIGNFIFRRDGSGDRYSGRFSTTGANSSGSSMLYLFPE